MLFQILCCFSVMVSQVWLIMCGHMIHVSTLAFFLFVAYYKLPNNLTAVFDFLTYLVKQLGCWFSNISV